MDNPTGSIDAAMDRMRAARPSEPELPTDAEPQVEEEYVPDPPAVEGDEAQTEVEEEAVEASEEQPEPATFEVNVNGETLRVTEEDLRKGYMMQADYTAKTQQVAEGRRALEAERQALNEKVSLAEDVVRLEIEDLESESALELKDLDPTEYYQRKERVEAKQRKLEDLRAERDRNLAKARDELVQAEAQKVAEAIPEWIDQAVAAKDVQLMQALWGRIGLTDAEMQSDNYLDHRLIVLSRKAALYDELMAAKPEDKKVKSAPKAAEPGAATTQENRTSKQEKDMRERLRKTGSMRDAQALLKSRNLMR